jgi:8-oxo-dGTP pyrophosphatase MutT (NUDIX family)
VTRHVHAAGGVLWRRVEGRVLVAVVHRPRYDDWSLPKGKLDKGEAGVLAAVREIREETGWDAVAGRTLGESRYRVLDGGRDVPKTVRWWAMRATSGEFVPGPEVDRLVWLDVEAAQRRVTAGRDSGPLRAFAEHPPETTSVLLVRHGSAGSSQDWDGPDDERPLDRRGTLQAEAIAHVLPAYGPRRVLSAPPLRCRQTVEPLAERLSSSVEVDAALAEASAGALPGRLCDLGSGDSGGGEGDAVVACSQGGVIPHAVGLLAAKAGFALDVVPASKGSLWALSFSRGRLVDVDYTADLTS